MAKVKFNTEQSSIVRAWSRGQSIAVKSVAGSGKTTVSLAFQKVTKSAILYVAFTNAAKDELIERWPELKVKTTYSLGIKALYDNYGDGIQTDANKYKDLVQAYCSANAGRLWKLGVDLESYKFTLYKDCLADIIKFALVNLMIKKDDWERLYDLCIDSGVDLEQFDNLIEFSYGCTYHCLKEGYQVFLDEGIIDYSEQIALPLLLPDVQFKQYQKIVVDEAQDLSPAQRGVVLASLAENGQLAIVGDPHQSIYAFAGASFNSFDTFKNEANIELMAMTYNFRCGHKIIQFAQQFVPHIQAYEGNCEGSVEWEAPPLDKLKGDFMVVGRYHSELIKLVINLVEHSKPFHYIGDGLVRKLRGALYKFEDESIQFLPGAIERWESSRDKVSSRVQDLHQALVILHGHFQPKTHKAFLRSIKKLVTKSNKNAHLKLSTIHASKGREADLVWFLSLDRKMPEIDLQIQQELHLNYVACTRARKILYLGKYGEQNNEV